MKRSEELISILSKLMDEESVNSSSLSLKFDGIFKYVNDRFVSELDNGIYTYNSEIIRLLQQSLERWSVFNLIPNLVTSNIVAVRGSHNYAKNVFKKIVPTAKNAIGLATNIPVLVLKADEESVYAYTYSDKMIKLGMDEFESITHELYKYNVEIRKLITSFIVYTDMPYHDLSILFIPEYVQRENEFYNTIKGFIRQEYLLVDPNDKWVKVYENTNHNNCTYVYGNATCRESLISKLSENIKNCNEDEFADALVRADHENLKCGIKDQFASILLDIDIYYHDRIEKLRTNIESLMKDYIRLNDSKTKDKVREYKTKQTDELTITQNAFKTYIDCKQKLLLICEEYDKCLFNGLYKTYSENADATSYIEALSAIFFKCIKACNFDEAEKIIERLQDVHYKHLAALRYFLRISKGYSADDMDINYLKNCTNDCWEIAKVKIAASRDLHLLYPELKTLSLYLGNHIDSGKEYYFLAKRRVDDGNFKEAKKYFEKSLELDYIDAGKELIKLHRTHSELNINIENLADQMVSDANYELGCIQIEENKRKQGLINLKIAAANEQLDAMKILADQSFEKCQKNSFKMIDEEENQRKIYNTIKILEFLKQRYKDEDESDFNLKIGILYFKLSDYVRAYELLKESDEPEAIYACAQMHQYGLGMTKNLRKALTLYKKLPADYRMTKKQIDKINEILKEKSSSHDNQKPYNSSDNYTATSKTVDYESSYCFITTAACKALHEGNKDCDELNMLRWFRDNHILKDSEDGKELVEEYYRIGPSIVKRINSESDPDLLYSKLWKQYIEPSYSSIKNQDWANGTKIYINMVKWLCERYHIAVKDNIRRKYDIHLKNEE